MGLPFFVEQRRFDRSMGMACGMRPGPLALGALGGVFFVPDGDVHSPSTTALRVLGHDAG